MPQYVEMSYAPFKAGEDGAEAFKVAHEASLKAPEIEAAWTGKCYDADEPKGIELIALWSSLDAQAAFKKSPEAEAIKKAVNAVIDTSHATHPPVQSTIALGADEDFNKVAAAGAVLVGANFVPLDTDKDAHAAQVSEMMMGLSPPPAGFVSAVHGWAVEDAEYPPLGTGKSKVYFVISAWESLDALQAGEKAMEEHAKSQGGPSPHVMVRRTAFTKTK